MNCAVGPINVCPYSSAGNHGFFKCRSRERRICTSFPCQWSLADCRKKGKGGEVAVSSRRAHKVRLSFLNQMFIEWVRYGK